MTALAKLLANIQVLPVLTINSPESAIGMCRALSAGGINAVEITLRTKAGLEAIRAVKSELPDIIVAAGTVTRSAEMVAVSEAGADFAVSPGMTRCLVEAAADISMPYLPGIATPSEVLQGREMGLETFKLFPAVAVGGLALLKSLEQPLAGVKFCPTGGLNLENFTEFLALPNVICVGGSWMSDSKLTEAQDWQAIEAIARETLARLS